MFRLTTERLFLRHFHILDGEPMLRVFGDAEVMRFGDGVQTKEWVDDWLRTCLERYYQTWGFGPYAIVERSSQDVIGYCGLFYFPMWAGSRKSRLATVLCAQFGDRAMPPRRPA